MNTLYKHQVILGNETYVYDTEHVYCVWQNAATRMDRWTFSWTFSSRKAVFIPGVQSDSQSVLIRQRRL